MFPDLFLLPLQCVGASGVAPVVPDWSLVGGGDTMMLPITMHKRNILLLIKIMTTVEAIHICTVVRDIMQI